MSTDSIASELSCNFIDEKPEFIQLICNNAVDNDPNDDCTSSLFGGDSQINVTLKVRSLKIESTCQSIIENDWDNFVDKFQNIEELNIAFAQVRQTISFYYFLSMIKVNASHNRFSNSPVFPYSIRDIDLSHNRISIIHDHDFKRAELQILDLSHNQILFVSSKLFNNCPNLKILRLENNQITTLDVSKEVNNSFQINTMFEVFTH